MGIDINTVLRLHSFGALFSGQAAIICPWFFGAVFHSLTSTQTLAFIARMYSVLVAAQAVLLMGVRQIESLDCLRSVATIYTMVFAGTAGAAWISSYVLHITTSGIGNYFFIAWLVMALQYGTLAVVGSRWAICTFTYLHSAVALVFGIGGSALPETLHTVLFVPTETDNQYNTLSRYYGILISGMALMTLLLTTSDAAAARPAARMAYSGMFGASAVILLVGMAMGSAIPLSSGSLALANFAGGFSIVLFAGLSVLYFMADMKGEPQERKHR
mmetsp:Transcript_25730/g.51900  ORF Transcript_25730/g.51900 Transcript_25730/m.51900 type:complete len:273 (-) Transcript_25730:5-823(-)